MEIWKDGETYLVKITNPIFGNFGKTIKVKYVFYDVNANGFFPVDEDDDIDGGYTEDDFELVDKEPVKKLASEKAQKLYPPKCRYEMDGIVKIDENEHLREAYVNAFVEGYFSKI